MCGYREQRLLQRGETAYLALSTPLFAFCNYDHKFLNEALDFMRVYRHPVETTFPLISYTMISIQ